MNTVFIICGALISIAAVCALIRVAIGPTTLNRAIALDMFVAMAIAGLGLYSAITRTTTVIPVLVVLALIGFVGSVSIARFVGQDDKEDIS